MKSRVDIGGILTTLPLFAHTSDELRAAVAAGTRERKLDKAECLFRKGEMPAGFYVVVYGQVKLTVTSPGGVEKVVDILGPRQSFGEAVMFMDFPYPVSAEALADTLLLHISRDVIFDLLARDPQLARQMLAGLSARLHRLVQDVESYSLRSAIERLIGFLLHSTEVQEDRDDGVAEILLQTSKQVIASRLNLTPETLSRVQHELIEAGLISVDGRRIVIHDLRRLREYGSI